MVEISQNVSVHKVHDYNSNQQFEVAGPSEMRKHSTYDGMSRFQQLEPIYNPKMTEQYQKLNSLKMAR